MKRREVYEERTEDFKWYEAMSFGGSSEMIQMSLCKITQWSAKKPKCKLEIGKGWFVIN